MTLRTKIEEAIPYEMVYDEKEHEEIVDQICTIFKEELTKLNKWVEAEEASHQCTDYFEFWYVGSKDITERIDSLINSLEEVTK